MSKVIILNAPPSSGKDIAADWIVAKYGAQHLRFKDQLYRVAAQVAGIPLTRMVTLASDRDYKDNPARFFQVCGKFVTPRQWLIHCSENIVKPLLGKDFFGKSLANSIESDLVVASDGGFYEELVPVLAAGHDVYVLRIVRDGYTFEGDSRNYFDASPLYKTILIENNGTLEQYQNKIYNTVDDIAGISGLSGAV
jgi:hypothetical protein